jgi:hypothetical protein
MSHDHIVIEGRTMHCTHCGFKQQVKTPAPIEALLQQMDQFTAAHKDCQLPKGVPAEAAMSDYAKGFDHGCDYIVNEIEIWSKKHARDVGDLIAHLKSPYNQIKE